MFTLVDLAELYGITCDGARKAIGRGHVDPTDLGSIVAYWDERERRKGQRRVAGTLGKKRKKHEVTFGGQTFKFSLIEDELEEGAAPGGSPED